MSKQQLTILIVEDETTLREVMRKYLEREGFAVLEAERGPQTLALLAQQAVDLIVLDLMLPDLDGFTITRHIRDGARQLITDRGTPIIMVTSRGAEEDRLMGFELGVDDYVVKPFSPRELVARVKAVIRRSQGSDPQETDQLLTFATMTIDPIRHMVHLHEQPINLTATEFDLLYFLARHPGQVFSRTQLLDRVWGDRFYGDESTVTVHIRRVREKIEPDATNPTFIQTVWGVGYKFEG
jgi:two-component system, OmpR family, response regulator ResD